MAAFSGCYQPLGRSSWLVPAAPYVSSSKDAFNPCHQDSLEKNEFNKFLDDNYISIEGVGKLLNISPLEAYNHVVRKLKITKVMVGNKRTTKAKRDYASILIHEPEFEAKHQAWRNKKFTLAAEQKAKMKAEREKRAVKEKPFREAFALLREQKRVQNAAQTEKKRIDALLEKLQAETESFGGTLPPAFQSLFKEAQSQALDSKKSLAEATTSATMAEISLNKIKEDLERDKKKSSRPADQPISSAAIGSVSSLL